MALQAMVFPNQFENLCCDWNWDGETITKASGFVHHIESASFLVSFKILLEVLANLRGLTLKLQMQAGDVFYAYNQVASNVDSLKVMRSRSERRFSRIFIEATKLGKDLHGEEFELKHAQSEQTTNAPQQFPSTECGGIFSNHNLP